MKNKAEVLRSIYLYLVSLTGILMVVFGIISMSDSLLNYFLREGQTFEFSLLINQIVTAASFLIVGISFFVYHWRIIVREKRIGKRPETLELETKMNLFESIFFYALSYAGLMIFAFAFSQFLTGFAYFQYIEEPVKSNGTPASTLTINLRSIIQGLIAMIIGAVLWLLSWRHIQNSYIQGKHDE